MPPQVPPPLDLSTVAIVVSLVGTLIGLVVWLIRLEGRVNQGEKTDANILRDLERNYATKTEITEVKGTLEVVKAVGAQTQLTVNAINQKMDAFLVSAVTRAHEKV